MPGVSAPDILNVKDKGLLGGSDLSVSGSAVTANLWTVDGANNNDVGSNRTILVYPSWRRSRSSRSTATATAPSSARPRGGADQHRDPRRHERVPRRRLLLRPERRPELQELLPRAGEPPKDKLSRNDFGWNVGGPIIKDKLHFFASQEWNREKRGTVRTAFVPTAAERAGDFSGARHRGLHAVRADRSADGRRRSPATGSRPTG